MSEQTNEEKISPDKWTPSEVIKWIAEIGFGHFSDYFKWTRGNELLSYSVDDLIKLGIPGNAAVPLAKRIRDLSPQQPQGQLKRTLNSEINTYSYEFQPQDPCDGSKPVVKVSLLNAAGLSDYQVENSERLLYVRDEVKDVWKSLENNADVLILGPPGTGKSSICWGWACYNSSNQQKTVLWLHLSRVKTMSSVLLKQTTALCSHLDYDEVLQSIRECNADILILDGITEADRGRLTSVAYKWKYLHNQRKIILVASSQIKYGIEDVMSTKVICHPSWTLEQMKEACNHKEFYQQIVTNLDSSLELDEAIERKFSLAGGSVRWMFGFNEDEAEKDINGWISKCSDMKSIVQGLHGDGSQNAVNHLLSKDKEGKVTILSRYIAFQLSKRCEASFVSEASRVSMALTNPSWDGWVFQIDFFMQLRIANESKRPLTLYYNDNVEEWQVPNQVEFHDPKNLQGVQIYQDPSREYENKLNIKSNDWLIPTKWNQGCYDAAQLLTNKIRIVQVTRAKSHSLKLQYVQMLIRVIVSLGFKIKTVDVVVVVPRDEVNDFKITNSNITSDLKAWKWDKNQLRVRGLIRSKNS